MSFLEQLFPYNQCPWDRFGPATIHFCEAQLCQWIVKPAETWSNIGFFIVGMWVVWLANRDSKKHLRLIGYIGMCLGICSGLFHATGTYWGEYLDVGSMILFVTLGFSYNMQRLLGLSHRRTKLLYLLIVGVCLSLMLFIRPIGIPLFGILFATATLIEWRIFHITPKQDRADYKNFKAMASSFILAWVIWTLDLTKIVCNPDNHWWNGHAFWHLVCSLNFYFVYRFYTQFDHVIAEPTSNV